METDVRTGRLVDWSWRGVPEGIQVYEHDGFVVLYKEYSDGTSRHVAIKGDYVRHPELMAAIDQLVPRG